MTKLNSQSHRKTVLKRVSTLLLLAAVAIACQGVSWAHSLTITSATPGCNQGTIIINFTVVSWDTGGDPAGQNSKIEVYFNGAPAAMGAFTSANSEVFSGFADAPLGTTSVSVSAAALTTWGDGYPAGQTDTFTPAIDLSNFSCGVTPPPQTGRFTGGGKVVVSNAIVPLSGIVTVTKGFEVDCDMNPAHENLELNWGGSDHFHMDQITSAVCTLQGNPPNPPKAPVNRIDATGTGSYDGNSGYTVLFTLWDQGEPGTNDKAGFIVCQSTSPTSCTGAIVLSVPLQLVTTGNIQAHVDQQ